MIAGLHLARPGLLARIDLAVYDRLLAASPLRAPSGRVVLVEIDERSLAGVGRWPWPRDRMASLLDRAQALGAAAIGLDILFPEPDVPGDASAAAGRAPSEPSALSPRDAALAAALGRGRVVAGYAFTFDRPVDRPCRLHSIGLARAARADAMAQVSRATGVLCNLAALGAAATTSGFLNASPDADGVLRRMPQIVEFGDEVYPGLALATVRMGLGARQLGLADRATGWPLLWLGDREIPLDADGSVLVRFRGPGGTFPRVSAVDLLQDRVPAGAIADRIVFVGVSALGLGDRVATPLGAFMAGAEVHATMADNLLRGDFVRRPAGATLVELALILGAVAGVALGFPALGWTATLPLVIAERAPALGRRVVAPGHPRLVHLTALPHARPRGRLRDRRAAPDRRGAGSRRAEHAPAPDGAGDDAPGPHLARPRRGTSRRAPTSSGRAATRRS